MVKKVVLSTPNSRMVTTNKLSRLVDFELGFAIWWKIPSLTKGSVDVIKQH
jgi:hypothetical protein